MQFDFPGNVRQLENICHWLTVMAPAQVIELKDLPPELLGEVPVAAPILARVAAEAIAVSAGAPAALAAAAPAMASDLLHAAPPARNGAAPGDWRVGLEQEASRLLQDGVPEVWEALTRKFESQLIHTALQMTRGRRIEAAQKLGIGRNTITRKIQELGLDD